MRELRTDSAVSDEEEISLAGIASALLRSRRTIAAFALIGAVVGLALGVTSTRKYVSTATFIPQSGNEQGASAGLAMAASQLGIRMQSGGGGWPAATYVELLASRALLEPIARDTLVVTETGNRRLAVMELLEIGGATPAQRVDKTVRVLRRLITATEVKRLNAVQVTVTTPWPSVSFALAERLISGVNRFNTQTRQSQASAERQFVAGQARDAERALRDAEDRMQAFLQRNRVATSPDLVFERDRLQRGITLRQQAYTNLLQSHEEARIREVRDTPVITVLEAPALATMGESRQSAQKAAMGGILGILIALLFKAVQSARNSSSKSAREFFQTLDDAMPRFVRRRKQA